MRLQETDAWEGRDAAANSIEAGCRFYSGRMFAVAWIFLGVTAALGFLLRAQPFLQAPWVNLGNVLHTHSHIAFLGWVYNAFFALAMRFFVLPEDARKFWRLFLLTQVVVMGILVFFPLQGYGRESTIFATLHMIVTAAFMVLLLRRNRAAPAARRWLWAAVIFLLVSSLGPLSLAPIMILGIGEPWRTLPIGHYLHFQYNGWFVFFLFAVLYHAMAGRGISDFEKPSRMTFAWLSVGSVLTVSLSALPMAGPWWLFAIAGAGGVAQVIGCFALVRSLRTGWVLFSEAGEIVVWLAAGVLGFFFLKIALQALAAWPALAGLATNRFTIIGFMHLLFLGVVTPMLIVWAAKESWLRLSGLGVGGLACFAGGAFVSQLALAYSPIASWLGWSAWPLFLETQAISAASVLAGVALIGLASWVGNGRIAAPAALSEPNLCL